MAKGDRRAKVTPETKEEARRLSELWAARSHPTQAEFGEAYGIGNQSAVGQFLRGDTPLSLKAALGFAQGLGCKLEDFSPRLAAEAAAIANMTPRGPIHPEVQKLAEAINQLPPKQREWAIKAANHVLEAALEAAGNAPNTKVSDEQEPSAKRRRSAS